MYQINRNIIFKSHVFGVYERAVNVQDREKVYNLKDKNEKC